MTVADLPPHEMKRLEALASGDPGNLERLISRRAEGEPLQYLEGSSAFGPIEVKVDSRVLIPRPETEGLYEMAVRMVRNPKVIVDLCTGSGALALALKHSFPGAAVFATDVSDEAIEVGMENRYETGLDVYFAVGDLYDPLPMSILGEVDLLVANPPYVSKSEFEELPVDVKREPEVALVSGPSGLEHIERIGASARQWLRPGGVVICEIGETQGVSAASSFEDLPAVVRQDLAGRDRYIVAVKP